MKDFHSLSLKGIHSMENEHLQFLNIRFKLHEGIALQPEEKDKLEKWLQKTGLPEKVEMSPDKLEVVLFVLKNQMTATQFAEKLRQREIEKAAAKYPVKARPTTEVTEDVVPYKKSRLRPMHLVAAAAVSCGIILGIIAIRSNQSKEPVQDIVKNEIIQTQNEEMKSGVMSDGTKYWVNASSSLTYPSRFDGTREVVLNGEAYFEVQPDPEKPFIVSSKGQKVQVLGTEFNITAYNDDTVIRTTVLGGAVIVESSGIRKLLQARQQSVLKASDLTILPVSRPEETIAWKRDSFSFKKASITEIAAELERYYGVSIEFTNDVTNDLYTLANFSRKEPITRILQMIESTNNIAFDIPDLPLKKGAKIVIRRKKSKPYSFRNTHFTFNFIQEAG